MFDSWIYVTVDFMSRKNFGAKTWLYPMPVLIGKATYPEGVLEELQAKGLSVDAIDALSIATAAGTIAASGICICVVLKKGGYYHLAMPRFDRDTLSGLYKVGSSSMVEAVCLRAGFLLLARLIAGIGTNAFAAYQIVSQVTSLSFTLGDGVSTAGTSLVGQSLGAKRKDLAMAHAGVAYRMGIIVSILLMTVILLTSRQIALLFTQDETIIRGVTDYMDSCGYSVIVANSDYDPDREAQQLRRHACGVPQRLRIHLQELRGLLGRQEFFVHAFQVFQGHCIAPPLLLWAFRESNPGPDGYEPPALTNCATEPY